MSYKSILVQLDASEAVHVRFELALGLAKQFEAHLTGLYSIFKPEPGAFVVIAGTAEYVVEHETVRTEKRDALERLFHAQLARAKVAGEWKVAAEDANTALPEAARLADLTIIGQNNPDDPESFVADQFAENLVLTAGRPVLLVPYAGQFQSVGSHVLFAWDGSREATRALYDALPFLVRATQVTVLTVNALEGKLPASRFPGADIAAIIARHNANVVTEEIEGVRGVPVADMLLSRASDLGADLIVMGCYGHSRWREWVLGGATRSMLKSMTVPVLMSH